MDCGTVDVLFDSARGKVPSFFGKCPAKFFRIP